MYRTVIRVTVLVVAQVKMVLYFFRDDIPWGDDPYLCTTTMIKIEITNISRNT